MYPYFFDQICLIAPKASKIPGWMAIFKCFSVPVWLSLLVANCVCGWFCFWFKWFNCTDKKHKNEMRKSGDSFMSVFIETWIILWSGPTNRLPLVTKERIFITTLLMSSIIISGTFQVNEFSTLISVNVSEIKFSQNILGIVNNAFNNSFVLQGHQYSGRA